ncbi:MAG: GMC family oxidoreductase N-terminal domain-containing protein [Deltaproteobacteria bacterium]|nr:GMC family oxidoreductase N-terminal domain-containing protein [Deltaproteobacteria bacterium]MCL5277069.1 GMC family oxidoreductase N-terminal domain-containing protein [Deltaproteobacteria bacterium]
MSNLYDAVIIGSGFGGSIPALRLAQNGKKVLVLEQGFRNTEKDFKQSWDPKYLVTMNQIIPSDDYAVFYRSGMTLGGGSVVFSGLMNRAPSKVFSFVDYNGYKVWPDAVNRQTLDPYYAMVEQTMAVRQATWDEVPKTGGTFARMMDNMGLTCDRANYPYINCRQCGFCEAGCIYGVKQSLMHNYIPQAEAAGVEFRTGCIAMEILPGTSGYGVRYMDPHSGESTVQGTVVILAAGAIGSAAILLRSKQYLTQLSPQVGQNFSNNGDLIIGFQLPDGWPSVEYYKGRTNAGVMTYAFWDEYGITIHTGTGPPAIFSGLNIHRPGEYAWGAGFKQWSREIYLSKLIMCVVIGLVTGEGYVYLSNDSPLVHFSPATRSFTDYVDRVVAVGNSIASANSAVLLQTRTSGYEYTANHMLGTVRIGDDPAMSPADPYGQIRGYRGLFVSDSGSIPGGTGVNLSLTTAANAERIADYINTHW